jgi:molybdopterin molybdotransferase
MRREFISWEESLHRLSSLKRRVLQWEKVPLQQSLGRVLAEDIISPSNSPSHPTSALDGYAIKAVDQQLENISILEEDNPAGNSELQKLTDGFAIKTFTGSLMPEGSDTLIPIENVETREGKLLISQKVSIGNGVRPVGEIYKEGEVVISRGTVVDFAEIGVMAELNIVSPKVIKQPEVAIISTGDEILEVGEERVSQSQIRSSNNYTLQALVKRSGGKAVQMGTVGDSKEDIFNTFQNATESGADFIVTTGGVSVGDYDFTKDVVEKLGFETLFHGVKIKPGQHILVAKRGNQVLLALPGFAYSSTITAILYLLPLIRNRIGLQFQPEMAEAYLLEKYYKKSKKTEFTACNMLLKNGSIAINFNNKKVGTSAILTNMLDSPVLLFAQENSGDREAGERVEVILL